VAIGRAARRSAKIFQPMSAGFKFLRPLNIVNRPYSAKKECHDRVS